MGKIKTLKQAKNRIDKLEAIIAWLAQNPLIDEIELEYDDEVKSYEDE